MCLFLKSTELVKNMQIKFPTNLETHRLLVDIANHILFEDEPPALIEIIEKVITESPFERENAKEIKLEDPAKEVEKETKEETKVKSRIQEKRDRKGEG
jgi:hypothetical protein